MTRQRILITGASSGLGAGMARAFAAKGRDLALCARRVDRLEALKAELTQQHPGITVAVAELDVTDHDRVPKVFAALADELGGLDRVIVNAGLGKGAPLGTGKVWANKATIETNLVAALVQVETALEMFKRSGAGHLVLISSVLANKGVPGVKAAYAASKAGVSSLGSPCAPNTPGADPRDRPRTRLHRIGDDREIRLDDADDRHRFGCRRDGARHRERGRPRRGAVVAVGTAGTADAGPAAATDGPI